MSLELLKGQGVVEKGNVALSNRRNRRIADQKPITFWRQSKWPGSAGTCHVHRRRGWLRARLKARRDGLGVDSARSSAVAEERGRRRKNIAGVNERSGLGT